MLKRIVIATGNLGKLREIRALLEPHNIEVLPQSDFNLPEAEEPHCTFIENALAKARHASKLTGLPALADDSGLCVDALGGAPGVISALYAGDNPRSDTNNNAKLLRDLQNIKNRAAHYHCVMVMVRKADDPQPIIAEGSWHGEILEVPRGEGGFGYDPLFLDVNLGKSGAELAPDIKNQISHRWQALTALLQKLS